MWGGLLALCQLAGVLMLLSCLLEESVLSLKGLKDQPPRMVARNNYRQGHFQKVEEALIQHNPRWNLLKSAVTEDGTHVCGAEVA